VRDCIVYMSSDMDEKYLEPARVLNALPIDPTTQYPAMIVRITDGVKSVEFEASVFLSKTYVIKNDSIKFGSVAIKLKSLSINVGWKILVEDVTCMTESGLD
jgi:hypothetical protein